MQISQAISLLDAAASRAHGTRQDHENLLVALDCVRQTVVAQDAKIKQLEEQIAEAQEPDVREPGEPDVTEPGEPVVSSEPLQMVDCACGPEEACKMCYPEGYTVPAIDNVA
jgi:hypothetical protein